DVKGFGGAVPAIDASATVKIGRDSDVIDTDQANGVIDMVDEILHIGPGGCGPFCIDFRELFVVVGAPLPGQGFEGCVAPIAATPPRRWRILRIFNWAWTCSGCRRAAFASPATTGRCSSQAEFLVQFRERLSTFRRIHLDVGCETNHLNNTAVFLEGEQ